MMRHEWPFKYNLTPRREGFAVCIKSVRKGGEGICTIEVKER